MASRLPSPSSSRRRRRARRSDVSAGRLRRCPGMTRARMLLAAAAVVTVALGTPAWPTPPACTASSSAERCPASQMEYRTSSAVPAAVAFDHGREIAIAAGQDNRRATAVAFDAKTGGQRWIQHLAMPGATSDTVLLDAAVHEPTGWTFLGGYAFVDNDHTEASVHALDTSTG